MSVTLVGISCISTEESETAVDLKPVSDGDESDAYWTDQVMSLLVDFLCEDIELPEEEPEEEEVRIFQEALPGLFG